MGSKDYVLVTIDRVVEVYVMRCTAGFTPLQQRAASLFPGPTGSWELAMRRH
jgi:hypothetical protein